MNSTKTKLLIFRTSHNPINETDHPSVVSSAKFLGITVEDTLKWTSHVDNLAKKLISVNYTIFKLKSLVNVSILRMAYFGLFQARVDYGIAFWGGSNDNLMRIFVLQKRILRTIFALGSTESCRSVFRSEGILTTPCSYILQISILMHQKTIKTTIRNHTHLTRNKKKALPETFRLAIFQKNIDYMGPSIYNKIPENIKSLISAVAFKKKTKRMAKWGNILLSNRISK